MIDPTYKILVEMTPKQAHHLIAVCMSANEFSLIPPASLDMLNDVVHRMHALTFDGKGNRTDGATQEDMLNEAKEDEQASAREDVPEGPGVLVFGS